MTEKNNKNFLPVVFTYRLYLNEKDFNTLSERYATVDDAMFRSCVDALRTSFVLWPISIVDTSTGLNFDQEGIRRYWVDKLEKDLPKKFKPKFRKILKRLMPENEGKTTTTHFDRP